MALGKKHTTLYAVLVGILIGLGSAPAWFNVIVDPFRMNDWLDLALDREEISLKAHYPLWKMIDYPKKGGDVFVLGDSRARALQDKYWSEVGADGVYNFSYGGATIPEIYDTFTYLKDRTKIKALVVGVPLRSFSDNHRGGLNRVPEAITMSGNPIKYYSSWFVVKTGWRNLQERYPGTIAAVTGWMPSFVGNARADARQDDLGRLLDPATCAQCRLPQRAGIIPLSRGYSGYGFHGLHPVWQDLWTIERLQRDLPARLQKQVIKSAKNDWRNFTFSETLFAKIEKIADWCEANDVHLIFVIPATIADMQGRIDDFGLLEISHRFRVRLAQRAIVIDFDYDNAFTRQVGYFKDAYHFDSHAARGMVFELSKILKLSPDHVKHPRRGKDLFRCQPDDASAKDKITDGATTLYQGRNCRVWESNDA